MESKVESKIDKILTAILGVTILCFVVINTLKINLTEDLANKALSKSERVESELKKLNPESITIEDRGGWLVLCSKVDDLVVKNVNADVNNTMSEGDCVSFYPNIPNVKVTNG